MQVKSNVDLIMRLGWFIYFFFQPIFDTCQEFFLKGQVWKSKQSRNLSHSNVDLIMNQSFQSHKRIRVIFTSPLDTMFCPSIFCSSSFEKLVTLWSWSSPGFIKCIFRQAGFVTRFETKAVLYSYSSPTPIPTPATSHKTHKSYHCPERNAWLWFNSMSFYTIYINGKCTITHTEMFDE